MFSLENLIYLSKGGAHLILALFCGFVLDELLYLNVHPFRIQGKSKHSYRQMDRQTYGDILTDGQTDLRRDRQIYRETDIQMDGQTD
jgi:hypothetical protein